MVKNIFRWFEYVKRRLIDYIVRRVNQINKSMIFNKILWQKLIHVPIPPSGIRFGCCCCILHTLLQIVSIIFVEKRVSPQLCVCGNEGCHRKWSLFSTAALLTDVKSYLVMGSRSNNNILIFSKWRVIELSSTVEFVPITAGTCVMDTFSPQFLILTMKKHIVCCHFYFGLCILHWTKFILRHNFFFINIGISWSIAMEILKFKVISKVLADRLFTILPIIISKEQKWFINGSNIKDYVAMVSEATNLFDINTFDDKIAWR